MNASTSPADTGSDPARRRTPRRVATGAAVLSGLVSAGVAAIAGLCCAGPVTVLLLGASGAVAAAALAPYRLPLLLLSAVLIAGTSWRLRGAWIAQGATCPVHAGRWMRRSLVIAGVAWVAGAVL